ncbi:hypothetical protein E2562_037155 [Oryza meyeriana var. granulata]|uniref:Uncharacterized protein n=1 Tax=Oryza meyeriana var. granulata TaxID=110450 RepID=A0A6G1CKF7_9ORYZ|nr:hypothetical protein E2562_037155 [Oryza meyeriana var. granulata]
MPPHSSSNVSTNDAAESGRRDLLNLACPFPKPAMPPLTAGKKSLTLVITNNIDELIHNVFNVICQPPNLGYPGF